MAANFFDQFDDNSTAVAEKPGNFFDQFDAPTSVEASVRRSMDAAYQSAAEATKDPNFGQTDQPDATKTRINPPRLQGEGDTAYLRRTNVWPPSGEGEVESDEPLIPAKVIAAGYKTSPLYWAGKALAPEETEGLSEGLSKTAAGFTTPSNLAILAAAPAMPEGVVGKLGGTALAAYFEAQAARQFPEQWAEFQSTTDTKRKFELGTEMAAGLGLPLSAVAHLARGESHAVQEPSAASVLQRPAESESTRIPGSERGRVEPSEQRQETAEVRTEPQNPFDQFDQKPPEELKFAAGKTPSERATNFLDPAPDKPVPNAVKFLASEEVPEDLSHLPSIKEKDGSTVVFDVGEPEPAVADVATSTTPADLPTESSQVIVGKRPADVDKATSSPRLLAGEKQGDLISSTQTEPFALVGERGTDFDEIAARRAISEAESERARAEQEKAQGNLFGQEPPATAADAIKRKFAGPDDEFGGSMTPVAQHIIDDLGGIISKSSAAKQGRLEGNSDLWDDAGGLKSPRHNKIYNPNGVMPDQAAQALYDAGLIRDPYQGAMWDALRKESQTATAIRSEGARARQAEGRGMKLGSGQKGTVSLAPLEPLAEPIRHQIEMRPLKERVAFGHDVVGTRANQLARQARNSVSLEAFGTSKKLSPEQKLDDSALRFVQESLGDKQELYRDLARVQASRDPKLAEKYAPIVQHAIGNFDRLKKVTSKIDEEHSRELAIERRAGLDVRDVPGYITRILDLPDYKDAVLPGESGRGGSRYFTRGRSFEKLADAIHAGYKPVSDSTLDLIQHRIEAGQRLVQEARFQRELRKLKAPDGNPIIGDFDRVQRGTYAAGQPGMTAVGGSSPESVRSEMRVPRGYDMVSTPSGPLVVHREFTPLFKALYGESVFPRWLAKYSGFAKRYTLVGDTFHVVRLSVKELAAGKGAARFGYGKGLSLLELRDSDLNRAVSAGDITPAMSDYARQNRPIADLLVKNGYNVGKVADNLWAENTVAIPGLRRFNPWVFQKLARGSMLQVGVENFKRNLSRFPELGVDGVARRTAKEFNEYMGNLQSQGIFKSRTYQDTARSILLAPNWTESQLRAELRGYGQIARAPIDLLRLKPRLGAIAQAQLTMVTGMLAANQLINYFSTGHSTFQNGPSHILDAFIPGGKRGFWFNPFEVAGEYAFAAQRYLGQHMAPVDVASRIVSNKLSDLARGVKDIVSGRDYAGRPFLSMKDRIRAAITDVVPTPIPLSGVLEKDPRQTLGYRYNRMPGSFERQALWSTGFKVQPEQSARTQMYSLAQPFRADKGYHDAAGEYTELRRALDNDQLDAAKSEVAGLLHSGKSIKQIKGAVGIHSSQREGDHVTPESFAGSKQRESEMLHSMTPDQIKVYRQAQSDHVANAMKLMRVLRLMSPTELRAPVATR